MKCFILQLMLVIFFVCSLTLSTLQSQKEIKKQNKLNSINKNQSKKKINNHTYIQKNSSNKVKNQQYKNQDISQKAIHQCKKFSSTQNNQIQLQYKIKQKQYPIQKYSSYQKTFCEKKNIQQKFLQVFNAKKYHVKDNTNNQKYSSASKINQKQQQEQLQQNTYNYQFSSTTIVIIVIIVTMVIGFIIKNKKTQKNQKLSIQKTKLYQCLKQQENIDEDKRKKQKQFNIQKNVFCQGLQNLGNTCYINSSIQCLYQLKELRQYLKDISRSNSQLIYSFSKLLQNMQLQKSNSLQIKLKTFILRLEQLSDQFPNLHQQNDVFQFLYSLLVKIEETNQQIKKLYQTQYKLKCQCINLSTKFQTYQQKIVNFTQMFCQKCKNIKKMYLISNPKYIIFKLENQQDNHGQYLKDTMKIFSQNQKQIQIKLISYIIYHGSRGYSKFGHYTACRKIYQDWFTFDDSYVKKSKETLKNSSIAIYKLK